MSEMVIMTTKRFSLLTTISILWLLTSCSLISPSNPSVKGNELLIQLDKLPPGWVQKAKNRTPYGEGIRWVAIYSTTPDTLDVTKNVIHSVVVFEREGDAITYWEEYRKEQVELAELAEREIIEKYPADLIPTQEYAYTSDTADQFDMYCYLDSTLTGQMGHSCEALARYGNVFSTFAATIVPSGIDTTSQSGEANLLHWAEMEALLKLIDKKFQQAGLESN
jgi:hypothetical protein